MIEITALENKVKQNQIDSLYLFFGEEKYLLNNIVNKIKKSFGDKVAGINYIQIGADNVYSLISDIETPAFGYSNKLIIVKDSGLFGKKSKDNNEELSKNIAEYIDENIEIINDSVIVIFIEEEVNKNELYKCLEKNGIICEFKKLKENDAAKMIKSICNAYKVNIDDKTLRYFIEVCGTDMETLINEIRKQIEYASSNGTITIESIDSLAIKQLDSIIFDLTDNLGQKNISKALEVLDNLLYQREPIQKILIMLYNHFKKIYLTKLAIEEKRNVAEVLDLKPNQTFLSNKYSNQARCFSKQELEQILQELINIDYKSKIGDIDTLIGVQAVLCKYCS